MLHREERFLAFVNDAVETTGAPSLNAQIHHFTEASPDSDVIEVLSETKERLYPVRDPELPLPGAGKSCRVACLSVYSRNGHRWRLLTHQTVLGGQPVWLLMSGDMDEHESILRSVRTGYFVLLPLVLLGSVLGGYALSRKALLPVGQLIEAARRLSLKQLEGRLAVPQTRDELQSLAEAWNDLLVRLEAERNRSTQFTMDLSHDLRSAMTVIQGNAELSLRRVRSDGEYRATLTTIHAESSHILSMLEDMLLAARSAENFQTIERRPVLFTELLLEVSLASHAGASMRQQSLQLPEPSAEEVWVMGDRSLLRRMLSSLIDNAIKYTPCGGSIALLCRREEGRFLFLVRDDGIGIAPELQNRVFDRLFRADAIRSRGDVSGSGLGLGIARWIAEAHGLRIDLVSGVNEGSTFTVVIPKEAYVEPPPARG